MTHRRSARRAVLERLPDHAGGVAVEVLPVGAQERHHLRRVGAARPCALGAEARDQRGPAEPVLFVVAVRLDPHEQPHVTREHVAVDDVGERHIGVEQHRAGLAPDRVDEIGLERSLLLRGARHPERVEHVDERLAVIGGDDGKAIAGRPDLLQGAAFGRGQGGDGAGGLGERHWSSSRVVVVWYNRSSV